MFRILYLSAFVLLLSSPALWGQEAAAEEQDTLVGWEVGAGVGVDLTQLLQINPRVGSGQNRIGLGGALNLFAKYRMNRVAWDNTALLQFGIQKQGAGPLPSGVDIPFQKSIDELRLNSTLGYKTGPQSKWFYAVNFGFLSQLTNTFLGPAEYPGNFLSDVTDDGFGPVSKLFSPAFINLSLGMDYHPNDNLSLFFSPLGAKFVIVSDDAIAALGVHGNPVTRNAAGEVTGFQNVDSQFGALFRAGYADKFLNDKLILTSALNLYSNYLNNPQNIDVDWTNEIAYSLFGGLKLSLLVNVFYDDDLLVQITDYDQPNGVGGLGKRVSVTQQLLLTYALTF